MSTQTVIVSEVDVKGYKLSVTSRDAGDDWKHLEEITYRTGVVWLIIADKLEQGDYLMSGGSVEEEYAAFLNNPKDPDSPRPNPSVEFPETFGEPRATFWDTYRGSKQINFHLNSNDTPQTAINTWMANQNAIDRLHEKFATPQQKVAAAGAQSAQDAQKNGVAYNPATDTPATPKGDFKLFPMEGPFPKKSQQETQNAQSSASAPQPAVEGAIVATRAPNSNRPDYVNGQLVSFTVTKIVVSSNKGSAVYQMWTPLGTQYPTLNVYKLKPDGNLKPDYEAIIPVLNTLNLSLDKPEANGTWRLVCKAAHAPNKDGADREYLNVVSLTAI